MGQAITGAGVTSDLGFQPAPPRVSRRPEFKLLLLPFGPENPHAEKGSKAARAFWV